MAEVNCDMSDEAEFSELAVNEDEMELDLELACLYLNTGASGLREAVLTERACVMANNPAFLFSLLRACDIV